MSRPSVSRQQLVERFKDLLREIEIDFNTVNYWNRMHPENEPINYDPDGRVKRMMQAIEDTLCRESAHKIPRQEWLAQIKQIAVVKYKFDPNTPVEWEQYAHDYYLECTPEEALKKDFKNA